MMESRLDKKIEGLPQEIALILRQIISRARKVIIIRGICAVLVFSLGAILLAMGIDSTLLIISPIARWGLSALIYGGLASSVYVFLVMPLARSFTLAGVARMLEAQHPEMQERISSAVELLTSSDDPSIGGSRELINALAKAAAEDASKVRYKTEVTMRSALPYACAAAALVLTVACIFSIFPRKAAFLLARATLPFANMSSIRALDIEIKPGDLVTKRGEKLEIEALIAGSSPRSARLMRTAFNGGESTEEMKRQAPAKDGRLRFSFSIPAVEKDFSYRVLADDAVTRRYHVTAVVPPVIEEVSVRIEYPAYTRMKPRFEEKSSGSLMALAESVATLSVKLSKPCGKLQMNVAGGSLISLEGQSSSGFGTSREFSFKLPIKKGLFGIYSLQASDEHGFSNPKFERAIQAVPDLPPIVAINAPTQKEIHLKRDDSFPCYFIASDDIGVASVEISLEKDGTKLPARTIQLNTPEPGKEQLRKFTGNAVINLSDPEFNGAAKISFRITAIDNLPKEFNGPQRGSSETYTIILDDNAQPFKLQALRSQEELLKKQLLQAKTEMENAKRKLPGLRELASNKEQKKEELGKQIEPLREDLAAGDATLKTLAEKLSDGYLEKISRQLDSLHVEHLLKARSIADQVAGAETQEMRGKLVNDLEKHMQKTIDEIAGMLKAADIASKSMDRAIELENLAEKQKKLAEQKLSLDAKSPSENSEKKLKKEIEDWRKDQEKTADKINAAAKEAPLAISIKALAESKAASQIGEKAKKLAAEESLVSDATSKAAEIQKMEKQLDALAEQESEIAKLAKSNTNSENAAATMSTAAERLTAGKTAEAQALQEKAEAKLRNALAKNQKAAENKPAPASDSSPKTIQSLAAEAEKNAALASASEERAKAAEKSVGETVKDFEEKLKSGTKAANQPAANALSAKEAALKNLLQKTKEATNQAKQAAAESKRLAKEVSEGAARINPAKQQEADNIAAQARQKSRDAYLKAQEADTAARAAEKAAQLAAEIGSEKETAAGSKTATSRLAEDDARKASAAAAAAATEKDTAEKLKKEAEKDIETLNKTLGQYQKQAQQLQQEAAQSRAQAQQLLQNPETQKSEQAKKAEQEAQKAEARKVELTELTKKFSEKITDAQKELSAARQAAEQAQQAANSARQAAEQTHRAANETTKAQNPQSSGENAIQTQKKSSEAEAHAESAKKAAAIAASNSSAIRHKLLDELAEIQKRLKDQTSELTTAKKDAVKNYVKENTEALQERQESLSKEARKLADRSTEEPRSNKKTAEDAALAAEKTDSLLKNHNLTDAAKSAAETAAKLSNLASSLESAAAAALGKPKDKDKEESLSLNSQLAEQAAKLASEQESLRREMEALSSGNTLSHASVWQDEIQEKSAELQKEAAQLQSQANELRLPQQGLQEAAESERALQEAVQSTGSAEKMLAKLDEDQLPPTRRKQDMANLSQAANEAQKAQKKATQSLERAAAKMNDAQASIEKAALSPSSDVTEQESASELPLAAKLARKAARKTSTPEAIQSAESMMAAANSARKDAEKSGANTNPAKLAIVQQQSNTPNAGSKSEPPGFDAISKRFGIKFEDWLKLPGNLQSEILQSAASEVPEEYRELVKRYFEELSKRGLNNK